MSLPLKFNKTSTLGHTCYFYEDKNDRLKLLTEYLVQGIKNNELCIYVTSYDLADIGNILMTENSLLGEAITDGSLQIFEMNSTYMPSGKFVAEYMLSNVKSFIEDAQSQGYSGLRTVGEMEWVTEESSDVDSALIYEKLVNTLNIPEPTFVGLCLYPASQLSNEESDNVLRVHPTVAYKNKLMTSPFYAT